MEKYIKDIIKIIKDNITTAATGHHKGGDTDLNTLGNIALGRLLRGSSDFFREGIPELPPKQLAAMRRFYAPYSPAQSDIYHRLFTYKFGKFYSNYLPADLYYKHVDRYFSDREAARFVDNKCYYYRFFSNVKLPTAVAMRIGQTWLDGSLSPVPVEKAARLVGECEEVVLKRAANSEGGEGVFFVPGAELAADFGKKTAAIPSDIVIQLPLKQHPGLAAFHESSVNTFRVISLLTKDKVKIYRICFKVGTGGERVDNGLRGGLYCGVRPDGTLMENAVSGDGTLYKTHPDLGYEFAGKKVPCLGSVISLVKKAHPFMGHFRLISWDVAVDEAGDAVLIEANLTMGGISYAQMCAGPLFGKDTKKILDEVFGK